MQIQSFDCLVMSNIAFLEGPTMINDSFLFFLFLNHLEVFPICFSTIKVSDHFSLRFVILFHCLLIVVIEPLQDLRVLRPVLLNLISCCYRVLVSKLLL